MIKMTMSRKELAEMGNHVSACSGVTFNESDDKNEFKKFKLYCGRISKQIVDLAKKWNDEGLEKFKLPEEICDALNEYEHRMENVKSAKKRTALREKFKDVLSVAEDAEKELDKFYEEVVDIEFERFPMSNVPLNVNGNYMLIFGPLLNAEE